MFGPQKMSLISGLCRQNETMRAAVRAAAQGYEGHGASAPVLASTTGTRIKHCVAAGRGSSIRSIESTAVRSLPTSGGRSQRPLAPHSPEWHSAAHCSHSRTRPRWKEQLLLIFPWYGVRAAGQCWLLQGHFSRNTCCGKLVSAKSSQSCLRGSMVREYAPQSECCGSLIWRGRRCSASRRQFPWA